MAFDFKKITRILSALVLVLIKSACTPDPLNVHGVPQLQSKIVVSSQLVSGYAVAVLLTKSIGALDASDDSDPKTLLNQIIISDAIVRMEGNGISYDLKYIDKGVYGAPGTSLKVNESYTLFVTSPSLGSVKATTTVKPLVPFADVHTYLSISNRDTLAEVDYSIKDSIGKNWYMINAQRVSQFNLEERLLDPWVTTTLLDDSGFDGQVKRDTLRVLFDYVHVGDTLAILLSNIDENYYNFMKKREDNRFGIASYLGEPINYPTNVEGGLGFFNLYVPDVHVFVVK
jgi:hypothetical protein